VGIVVSGPRPCPRHQPTTTLPVCSSRLYIDTSYHAFEVHVDTSSHGRRGAVAVCVTEGYTWTTVVVCWDYIKLTSGDFLYAFCAALDAVLPDGF